MTRYVVQALVFFAGLGLGYFIRDLHSPPVGEEAFVSRALYALGGGAVTYLVKHLVDERAKRNERIHGRIRDVEKLIHDLETNGCRYWCANLNASDARVLETTIKGLRRQISSELKMLKSSGYICDQDCINDQVAFYQSIMDGDFEGGGRRRVDPGRVERIQEAANIVVHSVRRSFRLL